jgi:ribosomal protein S18 acetylase RimI-like enzyme
VDREIVARRQRPVYVAAVSPAAAKLGKKPTKKAPARPLPVTTRLRLARAQDQRRLLEMMADFTVGEGIAPDPRRLRSALGRLLRERELGRVWLILEEGELAGYAVLTFGFDLEFTGRDAFLTELFVRRELRGRGIGRRALALVETQAVALKARAVHLMVRAENVRAFTLYASAGYEAPRRVMLSRIVTDRR